MTPVADRDTFGGQFIGQSDAGRDRDRQIILDVGFTILEELPTAGQTKFLVFGPGSSLRCLQAGKSPLFDVPVTPQQLPYFFFKVDPGTEITATLIKQWIPKNRPLIQGQAVGPVR